jgi:hypothetical protein
MEVAKTGRRVRKPGQDFELSDEELLVTPASMLSSGQRKRRRQLKRRQRSAAKAAQASKESHRGGKTRVGTCQGYNRAGEACKAYAVKGANHCLSHLNDAEKAQLGMKTLQEQGTEVRIARSQGREKISALATMREVAETAAEKILKRQFAVLGLEFVGFDEEGQPVIIDHGPEAGLVLHGVSKEGDVVVSKHADLAGQFTFSEKLWDRIYGKPRQTTVVEGGVRPVQVQPVRNVERAQKVASMLHHVGAIPHDHEGRRRSQPSEPAQEPGPKELDQSSNVTPLKREQ